MPKKIKKHGEENAVHVRLDSPLPLRKGMLSTVLDAANMLSVYEDVVNLRKRRSEIINSMASTISSVHKELKKLGNEYLPQLPAGEYKAEHELKRIAPEVLVIHEEAHDDEIERLKAEIAEIDRKLKNI